MICLSKYEKLMRWFGSRFSPSSLQLARRNRISKNTNVAEYRTDKDNTLFSFILFPFSGFHLKSLLYPQSRQIPFLFGSNMFLVPSHYCEVIAPSS